MPMPSSAFETTCKAETTLLPLNAHIKHAIALANTIVSAECSAELKNTPGPCSSRLRPFAPRLSRLRRPASRDAPGTPGSALREAPPMHCVPRLESRREPTTPPRNLPRATGATPLEESRATPRARGSQGQPQQPWKQADAHPKPASGSPLSGSKMGP
ncbi:unnamed protein product [Prorocentrum cordatum]|uniref:Fructose-bisphosphate aldolase n=1 Tax=Prorocentrum cordatum TaxID=2364126 RepID=A0ABN9SK48_9DINO|nr:unnamed protein product [Polarella glacialis]